MRESGTCFFHVIEMSKSNLGYVQELRLLIGHRPLIIPGAVILIINQQGDLLLQHRKDNQQWGLIGGSMEIGESLEETARRETFEESGLEIDELEWFGLFSGHDFIYQYPNQDVVVNVMAAYMTRQFSGTLRVDKEEAYDIRFFKLSELPQNLCPPDIPVIKQYLRSLNNSSRTE